MCIPVHIRPFLTISAPATVLSRKDSPKILEGKKKMEKRDSPVFVELLFTVSFADGEARSFPAGWPYSLQAHFHFLTLNYAFCILIIG